MKSKKSKNTIIILLIIIIVILATLVVLLATDKLTFNNDEKDQINDIDDSQNENNTNDDNGKLTENEAITILKTNYNDDVRYIFNEAITYCGETEDGSNLTLNGFTYLKSSSYNSLEELENFLKNYMTDTLLKSTNYNRTIVVNDNTVSSYYEQDGSLYCNGWNKGGNLDLINYNEEESTFTITNITLESFDATIDAVYYSADNSKTVKKINVSVIKQNNKWLLNSYDEVN